MSWIIFWTKELPFYLRREVLRKEVFVVWSELGDIHRLVAFAVQVVGVECADGF